MLKVLIIDDGDPGRVEKTDIYASFLRPEDGAVTRATLRDLNTPDQLSDFPLVITDLDGQKEEGENNPDNKKLLGLVSGAVRAGSNLKVKMISGGFGSLPDYGVDLSGFPELTGIVTLHNSMTAFRTIRDAIEQVPKVTQASTGNDFTLKTPGTTSAVTRPSAGKFR